MKKKYLALVLAITLVLGCAVGGTFAWLMDKTNAVVNTFTAGNIDITLDETKDDFKMVPGETIDKDPKVTVEAGSEACWLFVKVEKSSNYGTYLDDPDIIVGEGGWTQGDGTDIPANVYYRSVEANETENQSFEVLDGNKVTVKGTVTKAQMDALEPAEATRPTLTFTAYAVQKAGFSTAILAWDEAEKL